MSGTPTNLPRIPGDEATRPANAAHAGFMRRFATATATVPTFQEVREGGTIRVAPALATTTVAGALSAADYATLTAPPTVRVHRVGALNVNSATLTAITWDATDWDTHGMWGGGNPTRLTIPTGWGGYWDWKIAIGYASSAAGTTRQAYARQAGTTYLSAGVIGAGTATTHVVVTTDSAPLAAGQYLEAVAQQDTGGILALNPAYYTVYMTMTWLRPT